MNKPLVNENSHQGFEFSIDEKFLYSSNFKKEIETYDKNKDIEKAKFWLDKKGEDR